MKPGHEGTPAGRFLAFLGLVAEVDGLRDVP
jgi:hypothetical protein